MSPREKAKWMIDQYRPIVTSWDCYNDMPMPEDSIIEDAKKGALIAVDEIIQNFFSNFDYWEEVKQEIKNFKP
jgi:hypothetical protein